MNKLSNAIEPKTREFIGTINQSSDPQIYELSPEDAREVLREAQKMDVKKLPADIQDLNIPVGPKGQVSIRIVRPSGNKKALPAIMYFHGGGWVLGDKDTHDRLIREIANGADAAIVFVNFTPSPEAKYPVPLEEAYAATEYIANNGKSLNLDPSQLVVAGDSVGGNMATVVAMLAKERNGPKIAFQLLFYPVTDANFDTESYNAFSTGHWLTRKAMMWFWDNYLPDKEKRKEYLASPLRASFDQLKGLPPALVITGEFDVLRDEGEMYAHKLNESGVKVSGARYLGTIHDFVLLNQITDTPAPRAAIIQANNALKNVFSK